MLILQHYEYFAIHKDEQNKQARNFLRASRYHFWKKDEIFILVPSTGNQRNPFYSAAGAGAGVVAGTETESLLVSGTVVVLASGVVAA